MAAPSHRHAFEHFGNQYEKCDYEQFGNYIEIDELLASIDQPDGTAALDALCARLVGAELGAKSLSDLAGPIGDLPTVEALLNGTISGAALNDAMCHLRDDYPGLLTERERLATQALSEAANLYDASEGSRPEHAAIEALRCALYALACYEPSTAIDRAELERQLSSAQASRESARARRDNGVKVTPADVITEWRKLGTETPPTQTRYRASKLSARFAKKGTNISVSQVRRILKKHFSDK